MGPIVQRRHRELGVDMSGQQQWFCPHDGACYGSEILAVTEPGGKALQELDKKRDLILCMH